MEIERRYDVFGSRFYMNGDIATFSSRSSGAFGRSCLNIGSNASFDTFYSHLFESPVSSFGCMSELLSKSIGYGHLLYIGMRLRKFYNCNKV